MKKYIILILSVFIFQKAYPSEPLKIGIISDTHFLSEQLMDGGYAIENYVQSTARDIKNVPIILDTILNDLYNNNIDILLVSGDITKDGEKQSHIDFVKKLKPLQDKGVKVFVVPGNHDINTKNAKKYIGNKTFDVESVSSSEFANIYKGCGYESALKRDTVSLSYVAELNAETWLLAIDIARDDKYKKEGITSEMIALETEEWILDILAEAQKKQIRVIGMMHWGLVEHLIYQNDFFPRYLIHDWPQLATLFADNGMKAIFTGHFHSNDISEFISDNENIIYDIETGPLCSYPFSYRIVNLFSNGMNIVTKNLTSLPEVPQLAEENKALLQQLAEKMANNKLKDMPLNLEEEVRKQLAEVIAQIYILHVYGDERMTDDLQAKLKLLNQAMDISDDDNFGISELDFFPEDNNVYLKF